MSFLSKITAARPVQSTKTATINVLEAVKRFDKGYKDKQKLHLLSDFMLKDIGMTRWEVTNLAEDSKKPYTRFWLKNL